MQGLRPEVGQSAADAEDQPLGRFRSDRARRRDAGEYLGREEGVAARPVEELLDPRGHVAAEDVACQLGQGRPGQRSQREGRRGRSLPVQLRVLPAGEQPEDRGAEQSCRQDAQGEAAQRVGPLDVVDGDQHGGVRRAFLDQLGQSFDEPDALVVVAGEVREVRGGEQRRVAVQEARGQGGERCQFVQFLGVAVADDESVGARERDGLLEQRGLPDPGLAQEQPDRASLAVAHRLDQGAQPLQLGFAASQPGPARSCRHAFLLGPSGAHPLTDPASSPRAKCRRREKKTSSGTTAATKAPAVSRCHSLP